MPRSGVSHYYRVTCCPISRLYRAKTLTRTFRFTASSQADPYQHQNYPANGSIYRGWFPALAGERSDKEGIDIGPEALVGDPVIQAREPLLEPNQWPSEAMLPGWREAVLDYSVWHRFRPKRVGPRVSGVSSLSGFESRLMLYGI